MRPIIDIDKGPLAILAELISAGEKFTNRDVKVQPIDNEYANLCHRPWQYLEQEEQENNE